MADLVKTKENLEARGFAVTVFDTAAQAADYLVERLAGKSVGAGGSMTVKQLGLPERLSECADLRSHWTGATHQEAAAAQAYICSANGLAETGEIVNIDGTGNRVASTLYGHEELYLVVGVNKIAPDFEGALYRARNIAGPKNAQRLNKNTPCAAKGDRCYDCKSPDRICRGLVVLWGPAKSIGRTEVVLVNEELGI